MTNPPRAFTHFALIALLFAIFGMPAQAQQASPARAIATEHDRWFGIISDIHFDPFYDPSLVARLVAAEPSRWEEIFKTSAMTQPSAPGSDANFPLFRSALQSLANHAARLDYVIFGGDFFSHGFHKNYESYAADQSPAAYRRFMTKTLEYVAGALKRHFPRTPIIATLGNNDSYCGDYMIAPGGEFLYDTKAVMATLSGGAQGFASYPELGASVLPHPKTPKHYFIVLNNLYFSVNYNNQCGLSDIDPAPALSLWLESTLYRMKRLNASATLVMHVPLGIDAFSSRQACRGGGSPTGNLTAAGQNAILSILKRYPDRITAIFSGHTHMDEFRVLADDQGKPFAFQRIVPSLSPIFHSNPAYQLYRYDRATGAPLDYVTVTYQQSNEKGGRSNWRQEYDFEQAYGVGPLTPAALNRLSTSVLTDRDLRAKFIHYYDGEARPATLTDTDWQSSACALTNLDATSFSSCCRGVSP